MTKQNIEIVHHSQRLSHSYKHWLGHALLDVNGTPEAIAQALFAAPFILVSHGTEPDPIFNYGNLKALQLWELSWEEFTQMPSRKSAEEIVQAERNHSLVETAAKGYSHFTGIRISSTGKRFYIEDGTIWNVIDRHEQLYGQAAIFSKYKYI